MIWRAGLLALGAALVLTAPASAQQSGCIGETDAARVPKVEGGPKLRFGITPGVQTGQLVMPAADPRTPEIPEQQLAALGRLRAPGQEFVLRLHRFFWSDGEAGIQRFLELADRYTAAGYLVELQLRYHPTPEQEGDIGTWVGYVRHVVQRFGLNPRVVAIQVANEVNLAWSPDSSDGAYENAREALVQGVIAAKDEALKRGFSQLKIGFNWAYRMDPASDTSFWQALRDRGGEAFVKAVDWVGLDAYPGTLFPPAHTPGGEVDGIVNALDSLRCFMAIPGIPATVPIHVEENGWPTSPLRTETQQATVMNTMVRAFHDFRGTYNVTDYRWFNLRDGDSTSANFGVRYGIMRDDYSEKPAFGVYAGLVRELGRPAPAPAPAARKAVPIPRMEIVCRHGAPVIEVRGPGVRSLRARGRTDRRAPFRIRARPGRRTRYRVLLADGRSVTVTSEAPRCRR